MNDLTTQRLRDALAAAEAIPKFLGETSLDEYKSDFGLRLQIERLLEIVGEALKHARDLEPDLEDWKRIPEMHAIIGMRNRIIHGYDRVDDELVWSVARNNIGVLCRQLIDILAGDGERS